MMLAAASAAFVVSVIFSLSIDAWGVTHTQPPKAIKQRKPRPAEFSVD